MEKGEGNDTPLDSESYANGSVFGKEKNQQSSKKRQYKDITPDPTAMTIDKDTTGKDKKQLKLPVST